MEWEVSGTEMNRKRSNWKNIASLIVVALGSQVAQGGVPFNNLQGAGGVAFNPLAYPAGQNTDAAAPHPGADFISKPQFGTWYVHLGDVDGDWTSIGTAVTLFCGEPSMTRSEYVR